MYVIRTECKFMYAAGSLLLHKQRIISEISGKDYWTHSERNIYIDGLVHGCSNSSVWAMELLISLVY